MLLTVSRRIGIKRRGEKWGFRAGIPFFTTASLRPARETIKTARYLPVPFKHSECGFFPWSHYTFWFTDIFIKP